MIYNQPESSSPIVDKILSEMMGDKPGCDTKKAKPLDKIAKKHDVSIDSLKKELEKGIKVEMEHTTDRGEAETIALHHLEELPDYYTRLIKMEKGAEIKEDLNAWLGKGNEGGVGGDGWDRYNSEGKRVGKCGDAKEGEPYSACLSKEKAKKLGKDGIANFVARKRKAQKNAGYGEKGEGPKGRKPVFVKTKVDENLDILSEKNEPTNPELWSKAKSLARQKFDVYPSAYANAWAAKWYKKRGGSWKSIDEGAFTYSDVVQFDDISTIGEATTRLPMQTGQLLRVLVNWRGKHLSVQMFFPQLGTPKRDEITYAVNKIYPDSRVISYVPCEMDSSTPIVQVKEENQLFEFKKSEMACNKPKAQPVGDSLTGKSHVVKACENGKEMLIRFGQRGVKGSPKKEGESKEYKNRRLRFKKRHKKNIKKGKMSAAYWANRVKW